jgi:hypothetical protein
VRVVRFTPEKQTSLNLVPGLRRLGQALPGRLVAAEQQHDIVVNDDRGPCAAHAPPRSARAAS